MKHIERYLQNLRAISSFNTSDKTELI